MRKVLFLAPLLILTVFLSFGQSAWAQKSASVLPNGIWRVRWVGVQTGSLTQKLNKDGYAMNLMSPLEKSITAKDLAAASSEFNQLYSALNSYEEGLGDSLVLSDFYPDAEMIATKHTIAAEYGLSSKVSLGLIIPITVMRVNARFNADVSTNVAAISAKVQGNSALEEGVATFEASQPTTQTFASQVFTANGYSVPNNFSWTGLGDIELGAKIQAYKSSKFRATTLAGFRMPTTTHTASHDNLLDTSSGDKQWDLAFELATEFLPTKSWTLGVATRFTSQLPNSQEKALLRDGETGLPNLTRADTIQTVNRNLGDVLETELGASYQYDRMIFSAGYMHSIKGEDQYSGPAGFQVASLGENTDSEQHRYALGLKYTTLRAFVAKEAPIPMEVKIAYNDVLAGRNTTRAAYTRVDFILFFK